MPRLLYVESSPRGPHSGSTAAAESFLAALTACRPDLTVDRLELWQSQLPEFSGTMIAAKYARLAGRALAAPEQEAWQRIGAMVERLKSADAVVIATPMWNFSVPYKLKHWIDLVTQPGLTFSFSPEQGYAPLLAPRPSLVILSSAGDYATGISRCRPDMATPYLKAALAFIGLNDTAFVPVAPTVGSAAEIEAGRRRADAGLARLAGSFLKERAA